MDSQTNQTVSQETPSLLMQFAMWYSNIHGYTSLLVCFFGIATNIINVTILNRKDMKTPTNTLLTWLAIADILTMVPYVPFVYHFYIEYPVEEVSAQKNTYGWMLFMLFLINWVATTHTISIWLGVSLAVFRHVQMKSTVKGAIAKSRRMKQSIFITLIVFIIPPIVLIPNYMTNELQEIPLANNTTAFVPRDLKLATNETEDIVIINVLSYAITAKIIPCILIMVFSGSLIYTLVVNGRKRRRRLSTSSRAVSSVQKRSKTTRLLLVVVVLFVVTEFPQGMLIILSTAIPGFYNTVYMPLGDMMDFVALVNNAINFLLYCIMSQQFRNKFIMMYLKQFVRLKTNNSFRESLNKTSFTEVA